MRGRKAGIAARKDRTETVECTNRYSVLEVENDRGVDEVTGEGWERERGRG